MVPVLENFGPEVPEAGRVLGVDPGPRLLAGLADRRELPLGGEAGLPVQVQVLIIRLLEKNDWFKWLSNDHRCRDLEFESSRIFIVALEMNYNFGA